MAAGWIALEMAVTTREFARHLRQLRERAGWTQENLAEHAGLSRNYIGLLESSRREPSLSTLLAIARALSSSLDELVGTAEHPIRLAKEPSAYRNLNRHLSQVVETMKECRPKESELIATVVDSCVRLTRKRR